MSFLIQTGQLDRLRRAGALQAAGNGAFFGAFLTGSTVLMPFGFVAMGGTLIYGWNVVRCPKCRYNLSWHAVTRLGISEGQAWLQTLEVCPQCGYPPAPPEPGELEDRRVDDAVVEFEPPSAATP